MSKEQRKFELFARLQALGFTFAEACQLRRIEMTLHRWGELECGDGNNYASWSIERDETTGKPFFVTHPHNENKSRRRPIADRERGALKRLGKIVGDRNTRHWAANGQTCIAEMPGTIIPYHQTDPRGCALYLLTRADTAGAPIDQIYTRGLAVAA